MNLDRDLFLVISELKCGPIILEIETSRMTRLAEVIEDVRTGQYGVVLHVLQINPIEGICRDITHDHQDTITECNALIERNRR